MLNAQCSVSGEDLRLSTLFLDGFDGWRDDQYQYFRLEDGNLESNLHFLAPVGDEVVDLEVEKSLVRFIARWGAMKDSIEFDAESAALQSLSELMHDPSMSADGIPFDWCQMCDVYALHEPGVDFDDIHEVWEECRDGEIARYLPGGPPDPDLRMGVATPRNCLVCPGLHISDDQGLCEPCPPLHEVVGNSCQACQPGEVLSPSGQCWNCGFNQIVVGEQCVTCGAHEGPNPEKTACVECPADVVVNWTGVGICGSHQDGTQTWEIELTQPASGDICPDTFWIQVNEINDMAADFQTSGAVLRVETSLQGEECTESFRNIFTIGAGGVITSSVHSGSTGLGICEYPDVSFLSGPEIASGPTSRKFGLYFIGAGGVTSGEISIVNQVIGAPCVVR